MNIQIRLARGVRRENLRAICSRSVHAQRHCSLAGHGSSSAGRRSRFVPSYAETAFRANMFVDELNAFATSTRSPRLIADAS